MHETFKNPEDLSAAKEVLDKLIEVRRLIKVGELDQNDLAFIQEAVNLTSEDVADAVIDLHSGGAAREALDDRVSGSVALHSDSTR